MFNNRVWKLFSGYQGTINQYGKQEKNGGYWFLIFLSLLKKMGIPHFGRQYAFSLFLNFCLYLKMWTPHFYSFFSGYYKVIGNDTDR